MADKPSAPSKTKQLSIQEYAKVREKLAKARLKISFPWSIKVLFLVPLGYLLFLLVYYISHLRFLAEH